MTELVDRCNRMTCESLQLNLIKEQLSFIEAIELLEGCLKREMWQDILFLLLTFSSDLDTA